MSRPRDLRGAEVLVVAYILTITTVYVCSRLYGFGASWRIVGYAIAVAPIAALQVIHSIPRARPPRSLRFTLPAQALLTYVPFLFFGAMWIGLPAFLAGSMLILLRGRVAWAMFAVVVASSLAFGGAYYDGGVEGAAYAVTSTASTGLNLYGLSHLAGVVARVHATRNELADMAVTAERLRAARDLDQLLGGGLSAIARTSAAAATGAAVAEVVRVARRTLDDARAVAATYRAASRAADRSDDGDAGRVALRLLLIIYAGALFSGLLYLASKPTSGLEWAVSFGTLTGIVVLQFRHTVLRLRARRVRGRRLTLGAQVVLAYVPLTMDALWFMTLGPVAVSALFLLRGRAAWTAAGLILLSGPVLGATISSNTPGENIYLWVSQAAVGLVIFGLIWLVELAGELRAARAELARVAVLAERLRVAGDVHDLLGYGLSAITLKSELAQRLLAADPERARAELAEVARLARRTLGELRDVTEGSRELSLAKEVAAAEAMLSGLDVDVEVEIAGEVPRREADAALAAVLREAVTNVLRHSAARRVAIRAGGGRLEVVNDGVGKEPGAAGSGLGSMTSRVAALGGTLSATAEDGRFRLAAAIPAEIPVPSRRS